MVPVKQPIWVTAVGGSLGAPKSGSLRVTHPTPPHRYLILKEQCLCLQDSKKDDEVAVPVCAQEHERYYPAPPHPTGMILWCSKLSTFLVL